MTKKNNTVGTTPTFNRINIETEVKSIPIANTCHSLPSLGTATFIKKSGEDKLVSRPKISYLIEI